MLPITHTSHHHTYHPYLPSLIYTLTHTYAHILTLILTHSYSHTHTHSCSLTCCHFITSSISSNQLRKEPLSRRKILQRSFGNPTFGREVSFRRMPLTEQDPPYTIPFARAQVATTLPRVPSRLQTS